MADVKTFSLIALCLLHKKTTIEQIKCVDFVSVPCYQVIKFKVW